MFLKLRGRHGLGRYVQNKMELLILKRLFAAVRYEVFYLAIIRIAIQSIAAKGPYKGSSPAGNMHIQALSCLGRTTNTPIDAYSGSETRVSSQRRKSRTLKNSASALSQIIAIGLCAGGHSCGDGNQPGIVGRCSSELSAENGWMDPCGPGRSTTWPPL